MEEQLYEKLGKLINSRHARLKLQEQPWFRVSPYYFKTVTESLVGDMPRVSVLYSLFSDCLHLDGEYWECGVYKGGTAGMFAHLLKDYKYGEALRLFDTFTGLPDADLEKDEGSWIGMFKDTSAEAVTSKIKNIYPLASIYEGYIPDTFLGLENSKIAFAHIDTDMYKSYIDCLEFIYPRVVKGGIIVFDDYGYCPGAYKAVTEFFEDKSEKVNVLETIQAFVIKENDSSI
jgi:O-methyltransferase